MGGRKSPGSSLTKNGIKVVKFKPRWNSLAQFFAHILERDLKAMEIAHEKLRGTGTSDVGALIIRLADLQLTLEKEQARKEQQSQQLANKTSPLCVLGWID